MITYGLLPLSRQLLGVLSSFRNILLLLDLLRAPCIRLLLRSAFFSADANQFMGAIISGPGLDFRVAC